MFQNLGVLDPERERLLHLGCGARIFASRGQRPCICIQRVGIVTTSRFLLGDRQSLRGLFGVIDIVCDQFVIRIVGESGFG